MTLQESKLLHKIKETVAKETARSSFTANLFSIDKGKILEAWKGISDGDFLLLAKSAKNEDGFYVIEALLSWVSAQKPKLLTLQVIR